MTLGRNFAFGPLGALDLILPICTGSSPKPAWYSVWPHRTQLLKENSAPSSSIYGPVIPFPFATDRHRQKLFCLKKYRPPRLLRLAGHSWTCDSDKLTPDEWPAKIKHTAELLCSPSRRAERRQKKAHSALNGLTSLLTETQRNFTAVPVANTTTIPPLPPGMLISKSTPTTASACRARARSRISSVA